MKSKNNFNNAYPMYSWDICWDVSVTSKDKIMTHFFRIYNHVYPTESQDLLLFIAGCRNSKH